METAPKRESFDRILLTLVVILLLGGMAVVLDASFARAYGSSSIGNDGWFYAKRQAMWVGVSLIALVASMRIPYWHLKKLAIPGIFITFVLLIVVMIPGIGIEVAGARRWLGFGQMRFQPSEAAKLGMVLFLAAYSDLWRGRVKDLWRGFAPPVIVTCLVAALIAKEDLGTAITTMTTGLCLIFMMGARPKHMAALFGFALLGGVGFLIAEPYRIDRIRAWLDLIANPMKAHVGDAYQPSQGLIALGSGGVYGQGIMRGAAKHLYLPAEHTDYIFATWGQDVGLLGCIALLVLFAWLIVRGLTVAHRTRDWFGCLLAAGMTCIIGIQTLLNIAVVTGIAPCTGVPLPFISYGGSSLVFTTIAVGIILNISQYPNRGLAAGAKERQSRESRADGWRNRRAHLSRS